MNRSAPSLHASTAWREKNRGDQFCSSPKNRLAGEAHVPFALAVQQRGASDEPMALDQVGEVARIGGAREARRPSVLVAACFRAQLFDVQHLAAEAHESQYVLEKRPGVSRAAERNGGDGAGDRDAGHDLSVSAPMSGPPTIKQRSLGAPRA